MIYLIIIITAILNITSIFIKQISLYVHVLNCISAIILFLLVYKKSKIRVIEKIAKDPEIIPEKKEDNKEDNLKQVEIDKYQGLLNIIQENHRYLTLSVPVLDELTKNTQLFEENEIKKIFKKFEEIWKESETLIIESENSMKSIFDTNKNTNLGYILQSSRVINKEFNSFMPVLESMNNLADKFVNISLDSFKTISQTTKQIEDLAEQVKVISINVRIEAARVKDSGGFKVLGSDITKFADETSDFAKSTNEKIQSTLKIIDEMKSELQNKLISVTDIAKGISHKVNPFESILEESAVSLKDVIGKLHRVSGDLNSNIKGSLANLQFQDVTRQESDHIIDYLKFLDKKIQKNEFISSASLIKEKDTALMKEILTQIDKISTTGNEAIKIKEFCRKWNIKIKEENTETFNNIDEGTFLF